MSSRRFSSPAFRLVRVLELSIEDGSRKQPVRAEIFQDPSQPTHFRYRVWGLLEFRLQTTDYPENLPYQVLTTFCVPNLGTGDYFEAADLDAAEKRFYDDFEREFKKGDA